MKSLSLLTSTALALVLISPAAAQQNYGGPPATPTGPLPFTPAAIINPTDPQWAGGMGAAKTGAQNAAALTAAATFACSTGYVQIAIPAGLYNVATGGSPVMPLCNFGVSVTGAGRTSTQFNLTGNGDFIVYSRASAVNNAGNAVLSGFRTYRTDSPTAGRGIRLDHAQRVTIREVEINGEFIDFECDGCHEFVLDGTMLTGTETNSGSMLGWLHHTNATLTTTGPNVGAVIPVASIPGPHIIGQTYKSGDANIQAGSTIKGYDPIGLTITLSLTPTGTTGSSDTLAFADVHSTGHIIGSHVETEVSSAPFTYDWPLVVNDADGLWITSSHISWGRNGDMLVQAGDAYAEVDNILSDPSAYFDQSGGGCVDFEPYGGFTTTTSAPLATNSTSMSITDTPPSDITGYTVQINGVASTVTVLSGGATTSLTLSANPIAATPSGASVTFFPTGVTLLYDGGHNLSGYCQGTTTYGILANDNQLNTLNSGMTFANIGTSALVANAGVGLNLSNISLRNTNNSNAGSPGALVQGNASYVQIGGVFVSEKHAPPYWLDVEGQADFVSLAGATMKGSATNDVINNGTGTHVVAFNFNTSQSNPNAPRVANNFGDTSLRFFTKTGNLIGQWNGSATTGAYPILTAGTAGIYTLAGAGASVTTLNIKALNSSTAGIVNLGNTNNDTVIAGGVTPAITGTTYTVATGDENLLYNAPGTNTTTLPSASGNTGRIIRVRTIAFAVNSATSNVVPLAGGAAGTVILAATAGKWATLQSDGTNWNIIQSN